MPRQPPRRIPMSRSLRPKRSAAALIALTLLVSQFVLGFLPTGHADPAHSVTALLDSRAAEDRGALALGQAIKRLGVVASVLHTRAHPDDDDSGLLAYLARGRQVRTAYMS